jgi:Arc/MetJ-type ribon-helix-helix transcriptional regulator
MHIEFAAVDEQYIKESVKKGYFRSEAEAVRSAVRQAREQQEAKQLKLLEALKLAEDDIAAGRTVPFTSELIREISQEAIRKYKNGEKVEYNSDIMP